MYGLGRWGRNSLAPQTVLMYGLGMDPSPRVRLLTFRKVELGATKVEFARRLGCSPAMVGHIEAGRRNPGRTLSNAIQALTKGSESGQIQSVEWDDCETVSADSDANDGRAAHEGA